MSGASSRAAAGASSRAAPGASSRAAPGAAIGPTSVRGGHSEVRREATSIVVRLLAIHNLMMGELRRGFGETLTLARFDLLANLLRDDGQTAAQLSRRMLVTAGNLTGLVDRAARDGIVERRADPKDGRLARIFLTARGRRVAERAVERHAEIAESIVRGVARTERAGLRELLGQLRTGLADTAESTDQAPVDSSRAAPRTRGKLAVQQGQGT
jgi:DNA-binding MarR family transcriptional regulator